MTHETSPCIIKLEQSQIGTKKVYHRIAFGYEKDKEPSLAANMLSGLAFFVLKWGIMGYTDTSRESISRQLNDDSATLFPEESAEIVDMKKQYEAKQRVLKVKGALLPYVREGSKTVTYDKKNDRYKIRIPVALRKDDRDKITARSQQEAYDKMHAYLFGDSNFTVRKLFERVMAEKENDKDTSSLTVTRYRQIWEKHYEHAAIADLPITEIKASDIKRFFKKITEGRTISRKNFVNIKSIFNVVYDLAVESDIVANNLSRNLNCKDLKFKAVDNENVRYTDEDRDKILKYLDGMDEKTGYEYGIELMFCLCIRIGELRALRWSDVDFHKHTISISREIVLRRGEDGKNHFVEVGHTKGGEHGARVLPLSQRAEVVLKELRKQDIVSEHICCNSAGSPLDGNKFNKHLKKVTEAVGIPYLSSHKIRFWSVTALARATGGDIQTVMYAAGHVDKNTTLHYIRAVQSDAQMDRIKECFG